MSVIIDRRLNDRKKSAANRERFMRRYKAHIKRAVTDMVAERSITDMERGGRVDIPVRDIAEPSFQHGQDGDRETVFTGNRTFEPGDRIERPDGSGQGRGRGSAGGKGDGQDSFAFTLSREEFMQIFFDDLQLPRLVRNVVGEVKDHRWQRAGYTPQGAPTNLAVARSMRNALGRRIALTASVRRELADKEARLAAGDAAWAGEAGDETADHERERLQDEIRELRRRVGRVPFLDELDLRYRHRIQVPRPASRAVMFCLMDVSASMDERKKDLAKRFFTLLYLFLTRKYEKVEVVFIRHTDDAEEVDEQKFFRDPKTGGTIVHTALALMRDIIRDRFPPSQWNIYGAQASDGDAFGADPEKSRGMLEDQLLPLLRYYAYVEVPDLGSRLSTLGAAYRRIEHPHFAMRQVHDRSDIYPVFRALFSEKANAS